tara:strand:- start:150 stop:1217 length:1068 start_codon:yes stop_codon:yes gene_type:complete
MRDYTRLEYIWLDGYYPEPNLRSKTKILYAAFAPDDMKPENLPVWGFDGSSTQQAEGNKSDCLLKPVRVIKDPQRGHQAYLVMCEVLNSDGSPHHTNSRSKIHNNEEEFWFGFEQEYVITDLNNGRPLGFPEEGFPEAQGKYYCGVGSKKAIGRLLAEEHLAVCMEAGLNVTGINAEVMIGQWEYQILGKGAQTAADDLWLSRYILARISEKYDVIIELHPKPVKGDWNGSGMHANFSDEYMRETGGKKYILSLMDILEENHAIHIENYGSSNEERLTGEHETQHINKFSYGISDRGASIRIPISTANNWKGYLEDRRPASNADPYLITNLIAAALIKAKPKTKTKNKTKIKEKQ